MTIPRSRSKSLLRSGLDPVRLLEEVPKTSLGKEPFTLKLGECAFCKGTVYVIARARGELRIGKCRECGRLTYED